MVVASRSRPAGGGAPRKRRRASLARIPDEIIQAVRERVDLAELIGRYVALRPSGRNYFGLCPFHDEKTPSFHVHTERQIFHCFGCGVGGNCFTFLQRHENLSFGEAVRSLAAEVGIEIPAAAGGDSGVAERLLRANEIAQGFFQRALVGEQGRAAREYLAGRGLAPAEWERFGLGFAPDGWTNLVRALDRAGVPAADGERAGLLAPGRSGGHYDRLRGRVTFAIRDARGRILGFGGRAIAPGQEPKYLNTPESPIYRKREAMFGLPDALEPIRRRGRAVVVEGYFDAIALWRAGVGEAVATCGTALGGGHARALRRRTREVVLLFDGDAAGEQAVERALADLLAAGLRVRAAALPPGDDPDTLLAREGPEALARRVDEAAPALDGVIARVLSGGCSTPWEKADAVGRVAPLLARIEHPVERGDTIRRLALRLDLDPAHVEEAVAAERRGDRQRAEAAVPVEARRAGASGGGPRDPVLERNLAQLAQALLRHPAAGAGIDPAELAELASGSPTADVVLALRTLPGDRPADVAALLSELEPDTAQRLAEIAALDAPDHDAATAGRVVDDCLRWLRRRHRRALQAEITGRLRRGEDDPVALIREKARRLQEAVRTRAP